MGGCEGWRKELESNAQKLGIRHCCVGELAKTRWRQYMKRETEQEHNHRCYVYYSSCGSISLRRTFKLQMSQGKYIISKARLFDLLQSFKASVT